MQYTCGKSDHNHNFSANTTQSQIRVSGGVRTYSGSNGVWKVQYDENYVYVRGLPTQVYSINPSWNEWANILPEEWLRPKTSIVTISFDGLAMVRCRDDVGTISFKTVDGQYHDCWLAFNMMWKRRDTL